MSAREHERPRAYPTVLDMVQHAMARIKKLEQLAEAQAKEIVTLKECLREGK